MKPKLGIYLRASPFDQFHQPLSMKPNIELYLIATAFDQFHQPSISLASMVLDNYFKKASVLDLCKT
jgi:hypothetical protein